MKTFVSRSIAPVTIAALFLAVTGCMPQAGSHAEDPRAPGEAESDAQAVPEESSGWPVHFFLSDVKAGAPQKSFQPGEDIVFHYAVTNPTDQTLQCEKSDGGPAVRFSLYRDGRPIAHATEGLAFMQMIMLVPVEPGDHVFTSRRLTWEGFRVQPEMSPGTYAARAEPVLRCPDIDFSEQTVDFRIVAD